MEQEKKGNTIFLSVIGIATLLVAIIGATFAWFSATVTGNDTASSVTVTTATLGVTYTNGQEISLLKAMPGATSGDKTFTIAANGATVAQPYNIKWTNVTNTFAQKSDLQYTLSGARSGGTSTATALVSKTNATCPSAAEQIGSSELGVGETHTYTISVTFIETGSNQNSNQGKAFTGKIEVEVPNMSA